MIAPTRQTPPAADAGDIRPLVARSDTGVPTALLVAGVVIVGLLLFAILESRRRSTSAPATFPITSQASLGSPPPLYIPPAIAEPPLAMPLPQPATIPPLTPRTVERDIPRAPQPAYVAPATYAPPSAAAPSQPAAPRNAGNTALVIDNSQARIAASSETAASSRVPGVATDRTRSGMLANRSATVPQGTLLQAVLETAFDSTSPGFARALVQRDVRGFDGSRVLIPRGSRLIGEYRSDTAQGQKRVMIVWTRLIRPDGVTIALASPSTDPVGRGGVRAAVDTHFWERFGGAVLQSTLDLGVGLATRNTRSPVIVAGSVSNATGTAVPQVVNIPPTLRIAAGTSVSVFVARDLDFTGAAGLP